MEPKESAGVILQVEEQGYAGLMAKAPLLLQKGFMVKVQPGLSVGQFFRRQLNLAPDYIAHRISTIFLDGKPVDDIDSALLRDGSTLALSGAMPGLVGAVMRRDSFYASFRDTISYRDEEENRGSGPHRDEGMIRLKLFNLVMKELGPGFLESGIYLETYIFTGFLENQRDTVPRICRTARVSGTPVEPGDLAGHPLLKTQPWVRLTIERIK